MIGVCLKWVGVSAGGDAFGDSAIAVSDDSRFGGISPADEAALEWAIRLGEIRGEAVTAITFGPVEAEAALRQASAAGARRCLRLDGPTSVDGLEVATALAGQCADASVVWCGDYSLDRGTGSVPAFLAALLGVGMALGAVGIALGDGTGIEVLRRLDGGRRERLRLATRGVISVEGSTARLRRASLSRTLAATSAAIETIAVPPQPDNGRSPLLSPYRPRSRQLPPPAGGSPLARLHELTSTGTPSTRGETVVLDPRAAARRIVEALTAWGYLNDAPAAATADATGGATADAVAGATVP